MDDERTEYRVPPENELEAQIDGTAPDADSEQALFGESPAEYASRRLDEGLIDAIDTMCWMARFAEDENRRFQAAKYLLDRGFGTTSPFNGKHAEKEDDPLRTLIDRITNVSD